MWSTMKTSPPIVEYLLKFGSSVSNGVFIVVIFLPNLILQHQTVQVKICCHKIRSTGNPLMWVTVIKLYHFVESYRLLTLFFVQIHPNFSYPAVHRFRHIPMVSIVLSRPLSWINNTSASWANHIKQNFPDRNDCQLKKSSTKTI